MSGRKLISFDWAIKKILRSKANFGILEGFLSVLLNENLTIIEILDSESNKENEADKSNRVDIKVRDNKNQIIIVEVQFTREHDYLNRMLYGTSKVITEHIDEGHTYADVVKVVSVNIVFMTLGVGDDYVYHGTTTFEGIHTHSILQLTSKEKEVLKAESIEECYPEYFIIDVTNFNDLAKDSLDQWVYFLKNEEIKDEFNAPGLKAAKKVFDIMKMDKESRLQYENYIDNRRREISRYETGKREGIEEERIKQEKLRDEEKLVTARKMKNDGIAPENIAEYTGLSVREIEIL